MVVSGTDEAHLMSLWNSEEVREGERGGGGGGVRERRLWLYSVQGNIKEGWGECGFGGTHTGRMYE